MCTRPRTTPFGNDMGVNTITKITFHFLQKKTRLPLYVTNFQLKSLET